MVNFAELADIIYKISALIILISIIITFIRLIIGPGNVTRIVSLDNLTIISISFIVWISYFYIKMIFLDMALVYGLISFIGVIAFARYLERGI